MQTKLIIGLGNIGPKYTHTRHNIGFMAIDHFQTSYNWPRFVEEKKLEALISEKNTHDHLVVLAKPLTMMNLSGRAVQKLMQEYKVTLENVAIVHDELALPFGDIRVRMDGSSAGNRGVKSIIESVGGDFTRIRLGIEGTALTNRDTTSFVLSPFTDKEKGKLEQLLDHAGELMEQFIKGELKASTYHEADFD